MNFRISFLLCCLSSCSPSEQFQKPPKTIVESTSKEVEFPKPPAKTRIDSLIESQPVVNEPKIPKNPSAKVIHVFVALCDNQFQSIVPVPPKIGNGKDPENNLYWGCDLGTKTFIKKYPNWKLIQTIANPRYKVLERCVFKHQNSDTWIVADAYDGEFIKLCTIDFLKSCAGDFNSNFDAVDKKIAAGGDADLIAYIGHNGLMDFELPHHFIAKNNQKRDAVLLGCKTKPFFTPYLQQAKANSLIQTTGLMAPEAYTLMAAIEGWRTGQDKVAIHEACAQAYFKYQKCTLKGARNLFVAD
jgi:hypothetical protein